MVAAFALLVAACEGVGELHAPVPPLGLYLIAWVVSVRGLAHTAGDGWTDCRKGLPFASVEWFANEVASPLDAELERLLVQ